MCVEFCAAATAAGCDMSVPLGSDALAYKCVHPLAKFAYLAVLGSSVSWSGVCMHSCTHVLVACCRPMPFESNFSPV